MVATLIPSTAHDGQLYNYAVMCYCVSTGDDLPTDAFPDECVI